jgi:hypothetical protein
MRKSLLITALFSMSALSPAAFAEGANWLSELFPKPAVEPAAAEQVQQQVQPPQHVPHDVIRAQQEAMKRQEEAFQMQRRLQTQAMQRQDEAFEAQQQAERERFESQQKAKAESFKAEQKAREQDLQRQLDAFKAQQKAAADYIERMEQKHKAPEG